MTLAVHDPAWAAGDDDDDRVVVSSGGPGADALDLLYRRYAGALRRFCRSRLDNDADADDACQEAFLRAHQALPRFRPGAPMWPWLATIAANVCIDVHRTRRCESVDDGALDDEVSPHDPHVEVMARLRHQLVDNALDGLPRRYRAPIYLRDMEGWSYADIAELDGTTVAVVRGTLHRGRSALRVRLEARAKAAGLWPLAAGMPWLPRLRLRGRMSHRSSDRRRFSLVSAGDFSNILGPLLPSLAQTVGVALALASTALPSLMGTASAAEPVEISSLALELPQGAPADEGGPTEDGASRVALRVGTGDLAPRTPGGPAADAQVGLDRNAEARYLEARVTLVPPIGDEVYASAPTNFRCDRSATTTFVCDGVDGALGNP